MIIIKVCLCTSLSRHSWIKSKLSFRFTSHHYKRHFLCTDYYYYTGCHHKLDADVVNWPEHMRVAHKDSTLYNPNHMHLYIIIILPICACIHECTYLHVHEHVCDHQPLSFLTTAVPLSTAISFYPYLDTLFQCFVVDTPVPFCLHKLHLRENNI